MRRRSKTPDHFPLSIGARIGNLVIHAILMLGAVFMILPMVWMLATSFKPATEIAVWPPVLLPVAPTLANYTGIFEVAPFARFFLNSAGLSIGTTLSVALTFIVLGFTLVQFRLARSQEA